MMNNNESIDRLMCRLATLRTFLGDVIYGTPEHKIASPLTAEALAIETELWTGPAASSQLLAWRMKDLADLVHDDVDDIADRVRLLRSDLARQLFGSETALAAE